MMVGGGLVRGVSMRLGGLLVGGIRLGIRGDGMGLRFLVLTYFINYWDLYLTGRVI